MKLDDEIAQYSRATVEKVDNDKNPNMFIRNYIKLCYGADHSTGEYSMIGLCASLKVGSPALVKWSNFNGNESTSVLCDIEGANDLLGITEQNELISLKICNAIKERYMAVSSVAIIQAILKNYDHSEELSAESSKGIYIQKHDKSEYDLANAEVLKVGKITVEVGNLVYQPSAGGEDFDGPLWYNVFVGPHDDTSASSIYPYAHGNAKVLAEYCGEYGKKKLCSSGGTGMKSCAAVLEAYILTNGEFDW